MMTECDDYDTPAILILNLYSEVPIFKILIIIFKSVLILTKLRGLRVKRALAIANKLARAVRNEVVSVITIQYKLKYKVCVAQFAYKLCCRG